MRARVVVTLKREVLDPQGEAVKRGLAQFAPGVRDVRVGKVIDIELDDDTPDPEGALRAAATKLLANAVIEDFHIELPVTAARAT
jgi:phosphoribosylformylglycinamidine synthase